MDQNPRVTRQAMRRHQMLFGRQAHFNTSTLLGLGPEPRGHKYSTTQVGTSVLSTSLALLNVKR
eukprot:3888483-Amphidinium_carterae.4